MDLDGAGHLPIRDLLVGSNLNIQAPNHFVQGLNFQ